MVSNLTKAVLKTLGQLIKTARQQVRIPQQELADRLDVTRQTIIAIEKGSETVAIGTVFEAAQILGIPLMTDDASTLSKWQVALANFQSILPTKTSHEKKELDDDF